MLKDKQILTIQNAIELNEDISSEAKGKGRAFTSRFIEPGVAHYEEFGDVLITKETLDKFIQTMVGCPVIIKHKDIDDSNVDEERVGVVSNVWFNESDGWYYCSGIIFDKQAIDLVKNQGWNVSCTYDFESDNQQKVHNGKKIDREFTGGEFAHLALVPNPRYERANIVMNSDETENNNPNHEPAGTKRGGQFAKSKISESYKKENATLTDDENIAKLKDIKANIEKLKAIIKENKISEEDKNLLLEGIEKNKEYFNFHKEQLSLFKKSSDEIINTLFELAKKEDKDLTNEDKILLEILKDQKEVNNKGDITMTVLNDLKDFIKSVVNNEKDEKMEKEVKNEDKRKLIDEVGGILKGKVDDEIIKTIMKKMEEASYEPSEDDKADNEAEKEEKFEEEKEIADNKCKNEEKEEDEEIEKKEIENKCKNSMDNIKNLIMGGSSKVKSNYITKDERFALGENY